MYELFFENFNKKVALLPQEEEDIKVFLNHRRLRKNQYILQDGDDCRFVAFVEQGLLRQYSVDIQGHIHIVQFATEGWTIADLYSFLSGEPSNYYIDALEDSQIVMIDKDAHEQMLKTIPKYETYTRIQLTGAYLAMQSRVNASLSLSHENRYSQFIKLYPNISQRVPQHMIASYMGLQPETLSRIRQKISKSK